MPDPALVICLFLMVALVAAAVVGFIWSHRKNDPMGSLLGLGALFAAGVPAAVFGAMTAY